MSELSIEQLFLDSTLFRYRSVKEVGDKAIAQVQADEELHWSPDEECNSIATIVQHLHGNMLSRWTDFLRSDGEKAWRDRDAEFTANPKMTKQDVLKLWEEGWRVTFDALEAIAPGDLQSDILIRGQAIAVLDALQRQLVHYGYHVGQMVMLAKHCRGNEWQTLSIPRGESRNYRPTRRD